MEKKKTKKKKLDLSEYSEPSSVEVPPYELQNVVSTFSLGVKGLDLKKIAMLCGLMEYNPQCFAAATIRIKEPRTTALVFASGNVVCTGARTELQSRYAARKYSGILQKLGIPVCFKDFKIQNIVASAYTGFTVLLQNLSEAYGPYCTYEPDLFPGLILRSISPKLVFLVFRSGKIVITGAKDQSQIYSTYSKLFVNIISKYKDTDDENISSSAYRTKLKRKKITDL